MDVMTLSRSITLIRNKVIFCHWYEIETGHRYTDTVLLLWSPWCYSKSLCKCMLAHLVMGTFIHVHIADKFTIIIWMCGGAFTKGQCSSTHESLLDRKKREGPLFSILMVIMWVKVGLSFGPFLLLLSLGCHAFQHIWHRPLFRPLRNFNVGIL